MNFLNFFIHNFPKSDSIDNRWIIDIDRSIESDRSLTAYLVDDERINPMLDWFKEHNLSPAYTAIIRTLAGTMSPTHVEGNWNITDPFIVEMIERHSKAKMEKILQKQRNTAINIPIQGWDNSVMQYMGENHETCCQASLPECDEGIEIVSEEIKTTNVICCDVKLPHRIDNSKSNINRITLSFGFEETVIDIYNKLQISS